MFGGVETRLAVHRWPEAVYSFLHEVIFARRNETVWRTLQSTDRRPLVR